MTRQTVLITGGAGFIGSNLADALVEENEVRILDALISGRRKRIPEAATVIEADIREREELERAMEGVDVVFHEAAIVDVTRSVRSPLMTNEINSTAALSLLECARGMDLRVILASSAAIYGYPEQIPISEDEPTKPITPYGLQKLTLDRYATMYHELYGLETVALRYFNVYGSPGGTGNYSGVIDVFLERAQNGDPITVHGDGTQTRDFVHVDDVVRANLLATNTDNVGRVYNIGTGVSTTIRGLAETVREVTESDVDIVHEESRPGDIERSVADISKARRDLGYRPTVQLKDGLARLVSKSEGQPGQDSNAS